MRPCGGNSPAKRKNAAGRNGFFRLTAYLPITLFSCGDHFPGCIGYSASASTTVTLCPMTAASGTASNRMTAVYAPLSLSI